jgi:protein SCO1/2
MENWFYLTGDEENIRRVLSFCFDYDSENNTYVFRLFRITGTVILILLAGFVVFLVRPGKKTGHRRPGG